VTTRNLLTRELVISVTDPPHRRTEEWDEASVHKIRNEDAADDSHFFIPWRPLVSKDGFLRNVAILKNLRVEESI
jgi:hypothetical protein